MNLWDRLISIFFPHSCVICNTVGLDVCRRCLSTIKPYYSTRCIYCGEATVDGQTHTSCLKKNGLNGMWILFPYTNTTKQIIHASKYKNVKGAMRELFYARGHMSPLIHCQKKLDKDFLLVPIPLSSARLNKRGYNQATYLAQLFGGVLNLKVEAGILKRVIDTPPQSKLKSKSEKQVNISGAFNVEESCKGAKFVIVDDVFTSGSTTFEACRVLKEKGAKKVYALILAGRY